MLIKEHTIQRRTQEGERMHLANFFTQNTFSGVMYIKKNADLGFFCGKNTKAKLYYFLTICHLNQF